MADTVTLQARLEEAEAAYHALLTGSQTQTVNTGGGRSVAFTQAKAGELSQYIASLKRQIDGGAVGRPMIPYLG